MSDKKDQKDKDGKDEKRQLGAVRGGTSGGNNALRSAVDKAKEEAQQRQQQHRLAELRKQQQAKQAARAKTPIAPPPRPRPTAAPAVVAVTATAAAAALSDEDRASLNSLESSFNQANKESELGDVYREIGEIDDLLTNLPLKLDQLRTRGYVHSGHLEDALEKLDAEWDKIRPQVQTRTQQEVTRLNSEMDALEQQYNQLLRAPRGPLLKQVDAAVERAKERINQVENNLGNLYKAVRSGVGEVEDAVSHAEWMVQQIDESPAIELYAAEGPLLAVEAEWEQDGDEGPDGVLYLTDQRLLFEQKEEIATKKFLFVTTKSEKVQKLLLDVPAAEIEDVQHSEEGRGFLNMRKDDIIELVFSAKAPISRARFHLKGQESSDWAAMIKKVRSGEIDKFRQGSFVGAMEEAAAATASLPTQCPSCFAELPAQPRGVTSVTCDFCGAVATAA